MKLSLLFNHLSEFDVTYAHIHSTVEYIIHILNSYTSNITWERDERLKYQSDR